MTTTQKVRRRRRRSEEIKFYLVVDGTPNPEVLIQNYLWCLKQRELMRQKKALETPAFPETQASIQD